jgi:hypothetical protein
LGNEEEIDNSPPKVPAVPSVKAATDRDTLNMNLMDLYLYVSMLTAAQQKEY